MHVEHSGTAVHTANVCYVEKQTFIIKWVYYTCTLILMQECQGGGLIGICLRLIIHSIHYMHAFVDRSLYEAVYRQLL